jgi:hypothetical protein
MLAPIPTPRASDAERGGRGDLIQAVRGNQNSHFSSWLWPTPRACTAMGATFTQAAMDKVEARAARYGNLEEIVAMFPTPTAQDASNNGGASQSRRNSLPLNAAIGGALNPTWVEWLMGFPLGWTDCGPSATPSSRKSPSSSDAQS